MGNPVSLRNCEANPEPSNPPGRLALQENRRHRRSIALRSRGGEIEVSEEGPASEGVGRLGTADCSRHLASVDTNPPLRPAIRIVHRQGRDTPAPSDPREFLLEVERPGFGQEGPGFLHRTVPGFQKGLEPS